MVCCILFWIVAFPMYINRRPGFVRRFQTSLPAQPASAPPPDFEQQLMKLARLKESGVLTEAEFTAKKQEILGFDKKPSIHKIISLFVLLALAGCSASSSPPTEEINKGVNWALSASVGWRDKERNLFESFKITNQYTEKRKDGVACIYDFKAECRVTEKSQTDRFGNWKSVWDQGEGTPKDQSKAYTGTFTLIKKGDKWYRQETVR